MCGKKKKETDGAPAVLLSPSFHVPIQLYNSTLFSRIEILIYLVGMLLTSNTSTVPIGIFST